MQQSKDMWSVGDLLQKMAIRRIFLIEQNSVKNFPRFW
jgi:hypothetical protein